jgi:ribosomal protein L11 methyltransferase
MDYIEISIDCKGSELITEQVIALLSNSGFEGFHETDDGIKAFIPESDFSESTLSLIAHFVKAGDVVLKDKKIIGDTNWNHEWESGFNPVLVDNQVLIRAPFHNPDPSIKFDIVIEPKMSFGTGHHATTEGMIKLMLDIPFQKKIILDMGCGSGILGIMAGKLGASAVTAVDNDVWAFRNAEENFVRNGFSDAAVILGDQRNVEAQKFDIIMANITRNALTGMMDDIYLLLNSGGYLLMSGFVSEDLPLIEKKAHIIGLQKTRMIESDHWVAVTFSKG